MAKLKKSVVVLLIFILFFIDLILLFDLFQNNKTNNDLRNKIQKVEDAYKLNIAFIDKIKYFTYLQLKSDDSKLLDKIKFSFNDKTITLRDTSKWKQKIVLRFTEFNCSTCVDEDITLLIKFIKEIGEENVIIFATFNNLRNLLSFKENHKLRIHIFNIDELNLPIEQANVPYFFRLDNFLSISKVFVPQKEIPDLTEIYFNKSIDSFKVTASPK